MNDETNSQGSPPDAPISVNPGNTVKSNNEKTLNEYFGFENLEGPYSNLGAVVENNNGYTMLKFNISPGSSVVTNQHTLSYMDGGLSTGASVRGSLWNSLKRAFSGSSFLQNVVVNNTQNNLKLVLSPLLQGSIITIKIKAGETWRFCDKSFMACTPNINVSGNLNIFDNFSVAFMGGNLTYTVLTVKEGIGYAWVSGYGAIEKHVINMGDSNTIPLYINNGCFLGMLNNSNGIDYWKTYVRVGTSDGIINSVFTSIGLIMKIQDTTPSKGKIDCIIITQSLNPDNFKRYIRGIVPDSESNRPSRSSRPSRPVTLRLPTLISIPKGGYTRRNRSTKNKSRRNK